MLRSARVEAGLSQSGLAERSGVPKPRLSEYENDRLRPSLETLSRLADALQIPPGRLLPGPRQPGDALLARLSARGVHPLSTAEAERLGDLLADVLERGTHRGRR